MMGFIFSGISLSAVFMAAFVANMRLAILALWVAGLGVGAVYLTLGAELLAVIQWIVSTLITIAFIFFSVMFGEYNQVREPVSRKTKRDSNSVLFTSLSLILGAGFSIVIWLGTDELPTTAASVGPIQNDLGYMGKVLTQDNFLSLEVLALILFLVLVGGGVVARFEGEDHQ